MTTKQKTDRQEWEKRLDDLWFTKSGYQNENLPLIYDDIKELIRQTQIETERRVVEKICKNIEKYDIPSGFGSASGGIMKSAILHYLKQSCLNNKEK